MFVRSVPYFLVGLFYNDLSESIKTAIGPAPKIDLTSVNSGNILQFALSTIPPALDQLSGLVPALALGLGTCIIMMDSFRFAFRKPVAKAALSYNHPMASISAPMAKGVIESLKSDEWEKWEKNLPAEQIPIFTHLKKLMQGLQTMDLTSEQKTEVDSLITNLDETITLYYKGHSITKTLQSDDHELQRTLESQLHVLTQAATELAATINKEQLSNLQAHSLFLNERYQPLQLDKTVNLKKILIDQTSYVVVPNELQ